MPLNIQYTERLKLLPRLQYHQGRQTRQNSGGVAYLTKGGLQFFLNVYAIKISTF